MSYFYTGYPSSFYRGFPGLPHSRRELGKDEKMQPSRILIVDDEAIAALSIRMRLKRAGYPECQVEASGENAVNAVVRQPFDLIFMDIHLAGKMDGMMAAQEIRNSGRNTPLIFLSGYPDNSYSERIAALQPAVCLVKPINFDELLQTMQQFLPPLTS
jgi:CheY-like chemotaxis protein